MKKVKAFLKHAKAFLKNLRSSYKEDLKSFELLLRSMEADILFAEKQKNQVIRLNCLYQAFGSPGKRRKIHELSSAIESKNYGQINNLQASVLNLQRHVDEFGPDAEALFEFCHRPEEIEGVIGSHPDKVLDAIDYLLRFVKVD